MINQSHRGVVILALSVTLAGSPSAKGAEGDFRPVSFSSLSLQKPRSFQADFYVDDRDRDPLGIDVFDVGFRFRFQVGEKTGLFANVIADRVVALPEVPALPPSPRDLVFVGAARSIPSSFVSEHPYLDKRGSARVDAFIPGTVTVGFERLLQSEGLALGVSMALAIPMAGSLNALRSGTSSGRPDAVFGALASREVWGGRADGRLGFTLTGNGSWPDRSFSVTGGAVQTTVTDPPIGNRLDLGLAWIRPLSDSLAAAIEMRATKEFVGEERIDAVSPVDVLLGIRRRFGRFDASASLLRHFRALPSGAIRSNPLAGAVDLSNVSVADRNAFLARTGLSAVAGQLRDGAHIVVIGATSTSLPQGAVRIAPTYTIRSEHNLGYVFNLSFRP